MLLVTFLQINRWRLHVENLRALESFYFDSPYLGRTCSISSAQNLFHKTQKLDQFPWDVLLLILRQSPFILTRVRFELLWCHSTYSRHLELTLSMAWLAATWRSKCEMKRDLGFSFDLKWLYSISKGCLKEISKWLLSKVTKSKALPHTWRHKVNLWWWKINPMAYSFHIFCM